MPILTNILQKTGKSPKQNKKQKTRKESTSRPPTPVKREKNEKNKNSEVIDKEPVQKPSTTTCLLYTSDAADE